MTAKKISLGFSARIYRDTMSAKSAAQAMTAKKIALGMSALTYHLTMRGTA